MFKVGSITSIHNVHAVATSYIYLKGISIDFITLVPAETEETGDSVKIRVSYPSVNRVSHTQFDFTTKNFVLVDTTKQIQAIVSSNPLRY